MDSFTGGCISPVASYRMVSASLDAAVKTWTLPLTFHCHCYF